MPIVSSALPNRVYRVTPLGHFEYNLNMESEVFSVFDGNALAHRAYHALPPLTVSKTGEVVNAVYGFVSMLLKAAGELSPTYWAIAFDRKAPTFRHDMFREYKSQRPPTPEDLATQLERIRELVRAFNMPIFERDGYEADDIIGALAVRASQKNLLTIIVTGDADIMQLVSPQIKVLYPKPGRAFSDTVLYDEAAVVDKFGVSPKNIPDYKALVGDPSDNIPGVPGIGPKTAVGLIRKYGNLEGIYQHIDAITPPRIRETLDQHRQVAEQSKKLATINTDCLLEFDLEACRVTNYDYNKVSELFRELEFNSLLPKILRTKKQEDLASGLNQDYLTLARPNEVTEIIQSVGSGGYFALAAAMSGPNPMLADINGVAFSTAANQGYYIPVGGQEGLSMPDLAAALEPILSSADKFKIAHDGKPMLVSLAEHGVAISALGFDTMIAAYLLGKSTTTLEALASDYLGITLANPPLEGKPSSAYKELCAQADISGQLATKLKGELVQDELWSLFAEVEMPLVDILARMERNGVLLDTEVLVNLSKNLDVELHQIQHEIYSYAGHEFNINSPQQLGRVLFEELNLPPPNKRRGSYSTEATVLERLRTVHPIIGLILDYRGLAKLKSTYIDTLPLLINPRTGRIHTTFHQARTATGRLSSSNPNLQNIPVRADLGKSIRRGFVAPAGSVLLSADYSQIDLRVLAHLSQDEELLNIFKADGDIHSATAAILFRVPPNKVSPEMRRVAKTVNFGIIYGMSGYGLEQATEFSREESERFINAYFERHPGVKSYVEKTKEMARRRGYVESLLGRRRYIPEINANNRLVREAAERMAINMPVQGTSADIIKVAMVNIDRELTRYAMKSKLLLQVHDELIFEVPDSEIGSMGELARRMMSSAVSLSVPLKVDLKVGTNWGDLE